MLGIDDNNEEVIVGEVADEIYRQMIKKHGFEGIHKIGTPKIKKSIKALSFNGFFFIISYLISKYVKKA